MGQVCRAMPIALETCLFSQLSLTPPWNTYYIGVASTTKKSRLASEG